VTQITNGMCNGRYGGCNMELHLITYGKGAEFRPHVFKPIVNDSKRTVVPKPRGGLWSSPVNSEWGWADWCKSANYGSLDSWFEFKFNGRVYVIDSHKDAMCMPWVSNGCGKYIDFEQMVNSYDAIHLTVKGEYDTRYVDNCSLYGWDCESVLVMNKMCIKMCVLI
jgi:hypothetical protein